MGVWWVMPAGELLSPAAQRGLWRECAGVEGGQQSQPEAPAVGNEFICLYMGKEGSRGCFSPGPKHEEYRGHLKWQFLVQSECDWQLRAQRLAMVGQDAMVGQAWQVTQSCTFPQHVCNYFAFLPTWGPWAQLGLWPLKAAVRLYQWGFTGRNWAHGVSCGWNGLQVSCYLLWIWEGVSQLFTQSLQRTCVCFLLLF